MNRPRYILRPASAIFFAMLPWIHAAPKEAPLSVNPPPMAVPQNVSMYRGTKIEIPLEAAGRTPTPIKFLIRDKPASGTLSQIQVTGRATASIIYTHNDKAGTGTDSFTYAVQAMDSPVSARGRVQISVTEAPASLSVATQKEFGRLMIGKVGEQTLTMQNSGGNILAGKLQVPPPWRIIGSADYSLGRGQTKKITLEFAPTEEREYSGRLSFSHDARAGVALHGEAIAPLSFEPVHDLELRSLPGATIQSGTLLVTNHSGTERTLKLSASSGIKTENSITMPAEGKKALLVQTEVSGGVEGEIQVESEGFQHRIPVRVFTVPPQLQLEPAERLDFGKLTVGQELTGTFTVKNTGGSEARLKASGPDEIQISPANFVIPAGGAVTFQIAGAPAETGSYEKNITLQTDNLPSLVIRLSGIILSSIPPRKALGETVVVEPDLSATNIVAKQAADITPPQKLALKNFSPLKVQPRDLELTWEKESNGNIQRYIVEGRNLQPAKSGPPKYLWNHWQGVRFRETADKKGIIARFAHLPANGVWYIRIVGITSSGERQESDTFRLTSPPSPKSRLWEFFFIVVGLVLVIVCVVVYRRKRRERERDEAEQLSRLEKRS